MAGTREPCPPVTLTRWHLLTHRHQKIHSKFPIPTPGATLHPSYYNETWDVEVSPWWASSNTTLMERGEIYHHLSMPAVSGFCLCSPEFFLGSRLKIYLGMKASMEPLKCSTGGGGPSRMGLGLATIGAWYSQINDMEGWSEKLPPGPGFPPSSSNLLRAALREEELLGLVSETLGTQSG